MFCINIYHLLSEYQIETGTPYMLYKDACNLKSNQQNLGTIRCSNLCTEIVEYTAPDEVAVCNLASLNLSQFIAEGEGEGKGEGSSRVFDFHKLYEMTKVIVRNLNKYVLYIYTCSNSLLY